MSKKAVRKHPLTSITVNPELKEEAKKLGSSLGHKNFSETMEAAMEFWINNQHRL